MAAYEYVALDGRGRERRGVMEADSGRQIRQNLRDQGLAPLAVVPAQGAKRWSRLGRRRTLSSLDLALITRQMAVLIEAGLPIADALQAVARQTEKNRVCSLLLAVRAGILEGRGLAAALGEFPADFPHLYRATVAAGEHSGYLARVLTLLADYTEQRQTSRRNIQLAMLYPCILVGLSFIIVTGLLVYVIPQITAVFTESGQELPLLTRLLIALSDLLRNYGPYLLAVLAACMWLAAWLLRRPGVRIRWHGMLLRLPVVAAFSRGLDISRFSATLAILTRSGVPLTEALTIATSVLSNLCLREGVKQATRRVVEGEALSLTLGETGYFPPLMLQMIASGEASGTLDEMLARVAQFQEQEMERRVAALVRIAEPVMLLVMGIIVMLIVLAVLLPILTLNQLVAGAWCCPWGRAAGFFHTNTRNS